MKLMNPKHPVRASWIREFGLRFDASPYLSGAVEARKTLEALTVRKDELRTLTAGHNGGIYNGPQFVRNYVDDAEHGVRFLTSGSMLLADLSTLPYLSRRDAHSAKLSYLRLEPGMTLISCSGTIGRTVYCRLEMEGVWGSQDVMKVVPNHTKIPPGYLFAFLSSRFGLPIITASTYGSIIQHLEPHHLATLPVPRFGKKLEQQVHDLVQRSALERTSASQLILDAKSDLRNHLGVEQAKRFSNRGERLTSTVTSQEMFGNSRLEGYFYNPLAKHVDDWVAAHQSGFWNLGEVAEVFDVPPFKHIYVEGDRGVPFFTSGDLFSLERKTRYWLSRTQTKALEKYIIVQGWVLIARSGQLGGIIGRPQFTDSALHQCATSDHVIRIVPRQPEEVPPGYLFAYLDLHDVGYVLVTRTIAGKSVPALWPTYLNDVKVVKASKALRMCTHDKIVKAFEMRVEATLLEDEARKLVENAIKEKT